MPATILDDDGTLATVQTAEGNMVKVPSANARAFVQQSYQAPPTSQLGMFANEVQNIPGVDNALAVGKGVANWAKPAVDAMTTPSTEKRSGLGQALQNVAGVVAPQMAAGPGLWKAAQHLGNAPAAPKSPQMAQASAELPPAVDPSTLALPTAGGGGGAGAGVGMPGFSSKRIREIEKLGKERLQKEEELSRVREAAAAEQEGAALGRQRAMETAHAELAEIQGRAKTYRDEALGQIQQSMDEVRNTEIMDRTTTGNKVAAAIAMALGAVGSTIAGGPNAALEIVQRALDRDIEAQRANLANKRASLDDQKSLFAMNMARFGDEETAVLATKASMMEQVQGKLDVQLAKLASPEAKAAGEVARNQFAIEHANLLAGLEDRQAQRAMERAEFEVKGRGTPAGARVDGSVATGLADAQTAMDAVTAIEDSFDKKTGMFSAVTQHLPKTSAGEYVDETKVVAQAIGRYLEGGKMTDSDYPRYLKMLPTPSDSAERAANKLKTLKALIKDKQRNELEAQRAAGKDVSGFGPTAPRMGQRSGSGI